jgi:uracil phosphoribosyltransferase
MDNLQVVQHPLLQHSLTILRDKHTATDTFRKHSAVVSQIMILEATRNMRTVTRPVETPLVSTEGHAVLESVVFVPVLRAGLAMLSSALHLLPWASVGFIGLERDESTAIAREYYRKFPHDLLDKRVLVLDPMLATGGSLIDTIERLHEKMVYDISAVCLVAAPEGVEAVAHRFPGVQIYAAALDERLNSSRFILPGLGDFGDRYFGT